ncbi:hypothetical protein LJ739_07725 [Aestuariibacter halophilus]|uniref:J domain-containing protein n=1 Tax=Fluctibacter halophilus TaxID=226011 RepID=A0ABS8G6A2_9ALTE|nr:hypothetical protein [Aestuariibacter halophilus]MCC2616124.1 hypothetical protein [Aestuariibacter halophilus]
MQCWQRLGISPTQDKTLIEKAYRDALAGIDALQHPQDIDALVQARDEALVQADALSQTKATADNTTTQSKRWTLNLVVWGAVVVSLGFIMFRFSSHVSETVAGRDTVDPALAQQRQACNSLELPVPGDALDSCIALADSGDVDAQKRLAWLYTQEGETQDWQQVFDWLQKAKHHDKLSRLISSVLLFVKGESEEDKVAGEQGIMQLSHEGFAPADAYLGVMYFLDRNTQPRFANPLWMLEKAHDADPSLVTVFELVRIYSNGFAGPANLDKARQVLQQAAKRTYPDNANDVAWFLATMDRNPLTPPEYPLTLIKPVIESPEYADNFAYVDTLAAAYAATGEFDKAEQIQHRAIALLKEAGEDEQWYADQSETFTERLSQYQNGERPVYYHFELDRDEFFDNLKGNIENWLLDKLGDQG